METGMSEHPSRRKIIITGLTGAAGLAASTAMPAAAAPHGAFSPEYWECYRRYIDFEWVRAAPEADEDDPFEPSNPVLKARNACNAAREALLQRPVKDLIDVVALLRVDHWRYDHFVRPCHGLFAERERALRGAEKLAGVAPWDVPDWLVRRVADADAREAARQAESYCESRRGVLREDFF